MQGKHITSGLAGRLTGRAATVLSGLAVSGAVLCVMLAPCPVLAQGQGAVIDVAPLNINGPASEAAFEFVGDNPGVTRDGHVNVRGLNIIGPRSETLAGDDGAAGSEGDTGTGAGAGTGAPVAGGGGGAGSGSAGGAVADAGSDGPQGADNAPATEFDQVSDNPGMTADGAVNVPGLNINGPNSAAAFDFVGNNPGLTRDGAVNVPGLNIIGPRSETLAGDDGAAGSEGDTGTGAGTGTDAGTGAPVAGGGGGAGSGSAGGAVADTGTDGPQGADDAPVTEFDRVSNNPGLTADGAVNVPGLNINGPRSQAAFDFVGNNPGVTRDGHVNVPGLNIIGPRSGMVIAEDQADEPAQGGVPTDPDSPPTPARVADPQDWSVALVRSRGLRGPGQIDPFDPQTVEEEIKILVEAETGGGGGGGGGTPPAPPPGPVEPPEFTEVFLTSAPPSSGFPLRLEFSTATEPPGLLGGDPPGAVFAIVSPAQANLVLTGDTINQRAIVSSPAGFIITSPADATTTGLAAGTTAVSFRDPVSGLAWDVEFNLTTNPFSGVVTIFDIAGQVCIPNDGVCP